MRVLDSRPSLNSKAQAALRQMYAASCRAPDKVPDDCFRLETVAKAWGMAKRTALRRLGRARVERVRFWVQTAGGVRPMIHYRLPVEAKSFQ
jgi:hypothetical protein